MRREPEELVEVGAISGALNIPLGIVKVFKEVLRRENLGLKV